MSPAKTPDTSLTTLTEAGYAKLLSDLRKLWETGKAKAQRAISRQLLQTYWEIGGQIADEKPTSNSGHEKSVMARLPSIFKKGRLYDYPIDFRREPAKILIHLM